MFNYIKKNRDYITRSLALVLAIMTASYGLAFASVFGFVLFAVLCVVAAGYPRK